METLCFNLKAEVFLEIFAVLSYDIKLSVETQG
jgi:hypothetical protein